MDRMQRNNLMPTLVMLLLASLTAGCIAYVVPVDTWEKSSLQEYDFEQYVGIGNDVVIRDIGMPTFVLSSDERGETYFLYERTRFVESEWGHYGLRRYSGGGPEFTGDSGRVTNENGKSCYLLVFNVDNRMVRYDADWIRYSPDGRGENKRTPQFDQRCQAAAGIQVPLPVGNIIMC